MWTHGLLSQLLQVPAPADSASPYKALPNGANMRVSIRRTLRVGELSGTPVEDLGVRPDVMHKLTRADLLEGNVDLLDAAGELLAAMPVRRLSVSASVTGGDLSVAIDAAGVDRVDLAVDGRPRASEDVGQGPLTVTIPGVSAGQLQVDGYLGGELVASRRVTV